MKKKLKLAYLSMSFPLSCTIFSQAETRPQMRPVAAFLKEIHLIQEHDQKWLNSYIKANYQDDKELNQYSIFLHQKAIDIYTSEYKNKPLTKRSMCNAFLKIMLIFETPIKEMVPSEKKLLDANTNTVRTHVYPNLSAMGQKVFENNPEQFSTQLANIMLTMKILITME